MRKQYTIYYSGLFLILLLGIGIAVNAFYDRNIQLLTVLATAVLYVFWGLLHHHAHHDLTPKIMIEYTLIAGLGVAVVIFFLRGGIL